MPPKERHEFQDLIDLAVNSISNRATKSKRQWDIAKIAAVVITGCGVIFQLGEYKAEDRAWKKTYDEWKPVISVTVLNDHEYIVRQQGERNQQLRDRNDAAFGKSLTQIK